MITHAAYAFRNSGDTILTLDSIGWQTIDNPKYCFSGDERPDCGHVIFQYTIGGQGYLEYEGRCYPLQKGFGFLVKVPSKHQYYYSQNEEPWEIIWLNIRGEEANRIWDLILEHEGPIIRREADSPIIQCFWKLLRLISQEKMTDKYILSSHVYEWMLTLIRSSEEQSKELTTNIISTVEKAKKFMKDHYASPITLDTLSEHCEINKSHLCRLFQKSGRTSPLAYLRERRVEAAIAMLRTTDIPIREIGQRCGFDSPSYFIKVFREYMSMTPKEYRVKELEFPYDAIYYE